MNNIYNDILFLTHFFQKGENQLKDNGQSLTVFSTTRQGGCSHGKYGEMNINRYCGDNPHAIERNIDILSRKLDISKDHIIMPHQTHGTEIRQISDNYFSLSSSEKAILLEGTDALVTDVKDVCIGVSTADCIPIIIYDSEHKAAAAVHAGWRGTVKRIVSKTIRFMGNCYGSHPETLTAVIGPGISMDAFEVGNDVYEEFAAAGFNMGLISSFKNKWHINLPECNRLQLTEAGLKECCVYDTGICTYNNTGHFFSARRLGTASGRIFTGIIMRQT